MQRPRCSTNPPKIRRSTRPMVRSGSILIVAIGCLRSSARTSCERSHVATLPNHRCVPAGPASPGAWRRVRAVQQPLRLRPVIVDVVVDDATAQIRVERAVIAADAGEAVHPDGLANQLEGGVDQLDAARAV